jgi:hypothetical protein
LHFAFLIFNFPSALSQQSLMATDTQKYAGEHETRHSALEEFSRDERRPAVLLLSALVIAVLFFAIGMIVGRWTAQPKPMPSPASSNQPPRH